MLISAATLIGFCVLLYASYRFTLYLYSKGVVEDRTRAVELDAVIADLPARSVRSVGIMEAEDYGLRYARVGILIFVSFVILLVTALVFALFMVVH
jgi:hypothetical protein